MEANFGVQTIEEVRQREDLGNHRPSLPHYTLQEFKILIGKDFKMGAKALTNSHPKKVNGSKGSRRCRCCG